MIKFTKSGRYNKPKQDDEGTEDLRLCSNICTTIAAAVIQQWVADGKPKADEPIINIWKQVLKEGLLYDKGV